MQSRSISRLSRKLRNSYKITKSWRKTAITCHVLNADRKPNPTLAWRIVALKYEPGPDTYLRLTRDGALGKLKPKPRVWSDLYSMTKKQIAFLLENRESFI